MCILRHLTKLITTKANLIALKILNNTPNIKWIIPQSSLLGCLQRDLKLESEAETLQSLIGSDATICQKLEVSLE